LGLVDEIDLNMEALLETRQAELQRHVKSTLSFKRVPSLKRMCRMRGIRVGGRKADLVDRLVADVLEKGWTVSSEADLWKDYSLLPDSPADSKKNKVSRVEPKSISILDDSDSGRSSPPSSSPSSSPSSVSTCPSVVSAPDDSSVASERSERPSPVPVVATVIGSASTSAVAEGGTVSPTVAGSDAALGDTSPSIDVASDDGAGSWRKKRVALFVDTESPEEKRKKRLSDQSVDSGIHGASGRPHLTRRALKANLRKKSSSRRSVTDYLSRSNQGAVLETIKNYAIREEMEKPANLGVPAARPRAPQRPKPGIKLRAPVQGEQSGKVEGGQVGVGDVIPVSIISCGALRRRESDSETFIEDHPDNHGTDIVNPSSAEEMDEDESILLASFLSGYDDAEEGDDDANASGSSSTSVVAALTSPSGVPVAFITAQLSDNDGDDDHGRSTMTTTTGHPLSATPVIEWIPCDEMNVETALEAC